MTTDNNNKKSATFVLVHGSWGSGSDYLQVANILRKDGHRVFAPTLSGVGERSHLADMGITLETHIMDVVNLIRWEDLKDIVLVGHSYGGMVITGVADQVPERIASIIYLDAFIPENGQSLTDIGVSPEVDQLFLDARDRGERLLPFPSLFVQAFQIPEQELWRYKPQPVATSVEPIQLTGAWKSIGKKTYVLATDFDPGFKRFYEQAKADPSWRTATVPTGHQVPQQAPRRCAEILEQAI
jgi:pimeloyl-ACP methyl ester carboxylesterase